MEVHCKVHDRQRELPEVKEQICLVWGHDNAKHLFAFNPSYNMIVLWRQLVQMNIGWLEMQGSINCFAYYCYMEKKQGCSHVSHPTTGDICNAITHLFQPNVTLSEATQAGLGFNNHGFLIVPD